MIDHIYPIAFLGGSGGHFVSSWLNHAAYNIPVELNPSTGDAHASGKYAGFTVFHDAETEIEKLKHRYLDEPHKLFLASHIANDELLLKNFTKCTKIIYDEDDIIDIAINIYSKGRDTGIDPNEYISKRLEITRPFNSIMITPLPETEQSSNIHWKTLLYGETEPFVEYLASFYKLDPTNFDLESLATWRKLAIAHIENVKPNLSIADH